MDVNLDLGENEPLFGGKPPRVRKGLACPCTPPPAGACPPERSAPLRGRAKAGRGLYVARDVPWLKFGFWPLAIISLEAPPSDLP